MKNEIINIATLSKGRLKAQAEKVFKKNGLKIISKSERSLIGSSNGFSNVRVMYMNATEIIEALGKGVCAIGISGKDLWREAILEPVVGRIIMFPAWLWHSVEENTSNDIRISVSFNFIQDGFNG